MTFPSVFNNYRLNYVHLYVFFCVKKTVHFFFIQHRFIRKPEADVIPEQQPPSRGDGLRSAGPGPESTRSSSPVPGSSWVKSSRLFFSTPRAPRNQKTAEAPRTRRGQRHIEQDEESRNAVFSQTAGLLSGFSPLNEAASRWKTSVTSRSVGVRRCIRRSTAQTTLR